MDGKEAKPPPSARRMQALRVARNASAREPPSAIGAPMYPRRSRRVYQCVAIDVDTQRDFCETTGAFPVANTDEVVPQIRRILDWIASNHVPMISSVEAHRSTELSSNGRPMFCLDGTWGQAKIPGTILPRNTFVNVDNMLCCPLDLFSNFQQVIFEKRTVDLLLNPKADRFLTQLKCEEILVFGIGLESSIKSLVLGLLNREKRVTIVGDACGYWHRPTAELALRQITAKGARLTCVGDLLRRTARPGGNGALSAVRAAHAANHGAGSGNGRRNPR